MIRKSPPLYLLPKPPDTPKKHSSRWASRNLRDMDYWHKLSPKEKDWLQRFDEEYYLNRFQERRQLHKTKKMKLKIYSANDARQRSIEAGFSRPLPPEYLFASPNPEDALIEWIDTQKKKN